MTVRIEVTPEFEAIAVRLNGVLHLWIDRTKFLGLSSWIIEGRCQFFIEVVMEGGNITTDYDTREKWETVLAGIQSILQNRRIRNGEESTE